MNTETNSRTIHFCKCGKSKVSCANSTISCALIMKLKAKSKKVLLLTSNKSRKFKYIEAAEKILDVDYYNNLISWEKEQLVTAVAYHAYNTRYINSLIDFCKHTNRDFYKVQDLIEKLDKEN